MNVENPYQAPARLQPDDANESPGARKRRVDWLAWLGWPIVLALNLPLALVFARPFTERHGRIGIVAAVAVAWALGWIVCYVRPELMRRFLGGAVVVSLLQLVPVAQFFAGLIGLRLGRYAGFVDDPTEVDLEQVRSELGGFFVTAVAGGILMTLAAILSWLRYLMSAGRRRETDRADGK